MRSIPAFTGETSRIHTPTESRQVYPRIHGGNSYAARARAECEGLSPHSRGKRSTCVSIAVSGGSIPAFTGETWLINLSTLPTEVYPRIHGGNIRGLFSGMQEPGLSPHSRGKRVEHIITGHERRSIPAFTGETASPVTQRSAAEVYPRIHGGNSCWISRRR